MMLRYWVGWGNNVHLHFLTYMMLRYCMSSCTSSHIWCYAALPHIYDATLHFLTYMMLRYCMSSCTFSQIWCYVIVCRLALPHIYDATLHFLTYMMLRCTSSHTWCYATVCRLALSHRYDATLLYVVLHFLTDMMLRYCLSSCTFSQIWCYATVCRLALSHRYDATLLYVVLHFRTENNSHAKLFKRKKWSLSGRHSDYRQSMEFTEKWLVAAACECNFQSRRTYPDVRRRQSDGESMGP